MKTIEKILTIANPKNTFIGTVGPQGSGWFKSDGNCFKRQARICGEYYTDTHNSIVTPLLIPKKLKSRYDKRQWLLTELKQFAAEGIYFDRIFFFCHGGKYNLDRKMFPMVSVDALGRHLRNIAHGDCAVTLFSCWTGNKTDGFADKLSSEFCRKVIARTKRGHTTKEPHVILHLPFRDGVAQWPKFGGIRVLKKRLWASDDAPFKFIEEVLSGEGK